MKKSLIKLSLVVALLATIPATLAGIVHRGFVPSGITTFSVLPIGGGGYMDGITIANDGTKVVRNDSGDVYVATNAVPAWTHITNAQSLPPAVVSLWTNNLPLSTYEAAVAPTNSSRIYILWGGVTLVSSNQGATFTATTFPTVNTASANSNQNGQSTFASRLAGHHIAVDPQNPDVVYVCYPENGCWVSLDAGATANQITSIPPAIPDNGGTQLTTNGSTASGNPTLHFAATTGATNGLTIVDLTNPAAIPAGTTVSSSTGTTVTMSKNAAATVNSSDVVAFGGPGWFGYAVAVDGSSTLVNGRSSIVYALPYGSQVYKTTNAGTGSPTWAATSAGPTTYNSMKIDKDGTVYVVDNQDRPSARGSVWVYNGTAWTNPLSAVKNIHAIAPDPATAGRVMEIEDGGDIHLSTNHASTFTDFGNNAATRTAADVPWLAPTPEGFMSAGDIAFDPSASNLLYFAEGIGMWKTTATNTSYVWASQTAGIENLVFNKLISSPSYTWPFIWTWDRPGFHVLGASTYPTTQIPGNNTNIVMGWGTDYVSSAPGTVCALVTWPNSIYSDYSGCTTDGTNWTKFGTGPNSLLVTTTAPTAPGSSTLTVASLPANIAIGSTNRLPNDIGTMATTNGTTAAGNNVLHFASVPANVANGMTVTSYDNPANLQQAVSSFTSTTVTLGGNAAGAIASGERILFIQPSSPINSQTPITSASGTTITLGTAVGGSGVLAGETIALSLGYGGSIAASTPSNLMIVGQNNMEFPWYTLDGAVTWKNVLICATYSGGACATAQTGFNLDGSAIPDGPQLTTNGSTSTSSNVLHFASTTGVGGGLIFDITNPAAIRYGTTVSSVTGTTVTMSENAAATVNTSDVLAFGGNTGWGFAYYLNTKQVAADRVDSNTFYLYRAVDASHGGGLFMSTDGGVTVTRQHLGIISNNNGGQNSAIKTVPGNAGHIFISGGYPGNGGLGRSCDHGTTWADTPGISAVNAFGFGKPKPSGNGYPTVFVDGTVGGVTGIYRADDLSPTCAATTPTWIKISDVYVNGWINALTDMDGDQSIYGQVYVAHGNSSHIGVLH